MKLLLDENLPHDLRRFLPGHDVFTVAFMRWAGIKNGQLLSLAAANGFDALLTLDSGIPYQSNLVTLSCAVFVIRARSNKLTDLQPIVTELLNALSCGPTRTIVRIG